MSNVPDAPPAKGGLRMPHRVLHVIDSLGLGGAQVVLLNLLRHTDRTRFQPEVAALHRHGVFWEELRACGVPAWSLAPHRLVPSYGPGLLGLLVARRPVVVHCHLLVSNVLAKPLAAACGVPVRINHDHCNDKLTDPRRWALPADRWTNRFSSHVIAVSESTRRFVVEAEGVPAERTSTIHNGIDCTRHQPRPAQRLAARARWGVPAEATVVGGIGRLSDQKNFALFLEIAARLVLTRPELHFVLAGTGELESTLRAQAATLGLGERLHFLGHVADVAELYPALDLLLLTSKYEGLPMTLLEAMASGIPIVAPRLDGIGEVLVDGHDAVLVEALEPASFVAALEPLLREPARAAALAERALAKVRAHFSAERMTREVEAIYRRYLEGASR